MIATDKRKAVFLLHDGGMEVREIARRFNLSRNTVRNIIRQEGATPNPPRADKQRLDEELLRRLHQECQGRIARMHEKLVEEEGVKVTYPTLTRRLRELGISTPSKPRCERVPDEPGLEMQHDTSLYQVELAGRRVKLIASLIYLRYCKRRYLVFYRSFNRFKMKCFFHEALMFWGCAAHQCIIDNTNLARLRGTGANALIVPEMETFGKQYGFSFLCHQLDHPNRKAGEERSFWTVETNFLPGRTFASLEDLNQQALAWSTVRMDNRPQGKAGLIPAKAFEFERSHLTALPDQLPAPYKIHGRGTDEYGFVAFEGNYYWVPGTKREDVIVLEYSGRIKIFQARECLAEYALPADGVKNAQIAPEGQPAPRHHAHNCKQPTQAQEKHLRALGQPVSAYLDFVLPLKGVSRHTFIRKLLALSRKMSAQLLLKTLERALKYRITSLETVERIALLYLQQGTDELPLAQVDEAFQQREAYQQGYLTELPDLSIYQDLLQPPEPNHEPGTH